MPLKKQVKLEKSVIQVAELTRKTAKIHTRNWKN